MPIISPIESPYTGSSVADNHIAVVHYSGGTGDKAAVTAAVKTSITGSSNPGIVLLHRVHDGDCRSVDDKCYGGYANGLTCSTDDDCLGGWNVTNGVPDDVIATYGDDHTRPALVKDSVNDCLYYFATDEKTTSPHFDIVEQHTDFTPSDPTISWSSQVTRCDESNKLNNVSVPRRIVGSSGFPTFAASQDHSEDAGYYCITEMD